VLLEHKDLSQLEHMVYLHLSGVKELWRNVTWLVSGVRAGSRTFWRMLHAGAV
jgi:hypothetical protein